MSYQMFLKHIAALVDQRMPDRTVEIHQVQKNNSVVLDGLTIRKPGSRISPTIYLNSYYDEYDAGRDLDDIVDEISMIYEQNQNDEMIEEDFFQDFSKVRRKIVYKLVNTALNRGMLRNVPSVPVLDLSMVFYYIFDMGDDVCGTVLIQNHHLESWGVDETVICRYAKRNTPLVLPPTMISMDSVMKDFLESAFYRQMMDADVLRESGDNDQEKLEQMISLLVERIPLEADHEMFVLTNQRKYFGAAVLLYPELLKRIAERLDRDLYILPSSVHEAILVPDTGEFMLEDLSRFVRRVNLTEVEKEERLSNHAYLFRRKDGCISF
ncbi:MAG: DUF5688 family protein [Lachnospiraceae bacterium]|nr:DUF5688 family protein [Lachnospiraceae bacterium]